MFETGLLQPVHQQQELFDCESGLTGSAFPVRMRLSSGVFLPPSGHSRKDGECRTASTLPHFAARCIVKSRQTINQVGGNIVEPNGQGGWILGLLCTVRAVHPAQVFVKKLCMPILSRLIPASRQPATWSAEKSSGLASRVISAAGSTGKVAGAAGLPGPPGFQEAGRASAKINRLHDLPPK